MGDKSKQILKAAEEHFADGRYHEVTLDHICKSAGVGKGTVYRYFEDKEDLFYQVILSGMDELVESVVEVGEMDCTPREALQKVACRMAHFFGRREALFSLMHTEQLRKSVQKKKMWGQWRARWKSMIDIIAGFIHRGVAEGVYDDRFPAEAAARLLVGMLRTGMRHKSEMPGGRNWPVAITELFERGIIARESGT